jgi:SOS-response transcriptional repressor LexA
MKQQKEVKYTIIGGKLREFMHLMQIGNNELSRQVGTSSSRMSKITSGVTEPGANLIYSIAKAYPDLNMDWLLRGSPYMLVSQIPTEESKNNISMVAAKDMGAYIENHENPEYLKKLPTFSLPNDDFKDGTYRCFEVKGDSMSKTILQGDWVICKKVDDLEKDIKEGYIHVIVTHDGVLVKRVLNRIKERNQLALLCDNPDYYTVSADRDDIKEVWYAKARVSYVFLAQSEKQIGIELNQLKAEIISLKDDVSMLRAR